MTRTARTAIGVAAAGALALTLGGCGVLGSPSSGDIAAGAATTAPAQAGSTESPAPSTPSVSPSSGDPTTPTPSDSATPTPTPTPSESATPTPSSTPTPTKRTMLRPGDKGDDVRAVQKRLAALGYWLGPADGVYGDLTLQAVYALQKAAGTGRDGIVGPRTKQAIDKGVRPTAHISGDGVEIDISRQLLIIVRGGTVKYAFNTSTGSGQEYISSYGTRAIATTPTGHYSVFRTVDGMAHGKLGDLWRPRFFNGGIAVHGSGSIPPYPASHGCARVSNSAINLIWAQNLMPIGSRVVVT